MAAGGELWDVAVLRSADVEVEGAEFVVASGCPFADVPVVACWNDWCGQSGRNEASGGESDCEELHFGFVMIANVL